MVIEICKPLKDFILIKYRHDKKKKKKFWNVMNKPKKSRKVKYTTVPSSY